MKMHYMVESDTHTYDSACYEPACNVRVFWDGVFKVGGVTCGNCKRTEIFKYYEELEEQARLAQGRG